MPNPVLDTEKISAATNEFAQKDLSSAEGLLAAGKIYVEALARFKKESPEFREAIGEEAIREFATQELNELIYDIQDSIPVLVKTYNSLLRDKGHTADGPLG